jgi:MFS family permease
MSQVELLRARRFAPLFWTQFLGALNDNVFRFALIIFVTFTLAERSAMDPRTLVVMTGGVFIVPFFLFSALAGQLADKFEKSRLIRFIKTTEVLVMALGAVGFVLGSTYLLLTVLFLMGTQSAFFGPLKYSVLPQHLQTHELTGGNGLIQMGTYVAILGGSVLGGLLASLGQLAPQAIIVSIVGLALLGRFAAQSIPPAEPGAPLLALDYNPVTSTWALLAESKRDASVFVIIMLISMFWFVGATYLSIVPSYAKDTLNANAQAVTLLTAAFTIGIGIGSISCEFLSRGRIELGLVPYAALVISVASFDIWVMGTPHPPALQLTVSSFLAEPAARRMFIDLVIIGAAGALYIVPLYAALQARAQDAHRARLLAALNVTNALFMVGSAMFTLLLFRVGVSVAGVFATVGVLNLCFVACGIRAAPDFLHRARQLFRNR